VRLVSPSAGDGGGKTFFDNLSSGRFLIGGKGVPGFQAVTRGRGGGRSRGA
jgi:hypothetical protein